MKKEKKKNSYAKEDILSPGSGGCSFHPYPWHSLAVPPPPQIMGICTVLGAWAGLDHSYPVLLPTVFF